MVMWPMALLAFARKLSVAALADFFAFSTSFHLHDPDLVIYPASLVIVVAMQPFCSTYVLDMQGSLI